MTASRVKILCRWRVSQALPFGLQVWFDPEVEELVLMELEPSDIPRVGEVLEGVDPIVSPDGESSKNEFVQDELPF